jgi:hypothetical protein
MGESWTRLFDRHAADNERRLAAMNERISKAATLFAAMNDAPNGPQRCEVAKQDYRIGEVGDVDGRLHGSGAQDDSGRWRR